LFLLFFSCFLANTGLHPFCYLCCSWAGFSWAVLGEVVPSPGRRQRIFRNVQAVGAGRPFTLHFNKAKPGLAAKKWDASSPEKGAALLHHCYTQCLGLVLAHTDWEQ